ncbi:integral membrane sensor signal transduction histidine kinase [Nakamurella silvestris]|nr:integral membrane sensor signal transduction histidine kinase [Nakamurella silvestris]
MSPASTAPRPDWIPLAAGTPIREEVPLQRRRVFVQVIVVAVLVIIVVALVGVFAARRLAESEAVNDAAATADLLADTVVQPAIVDGLLTGDPAALAAIDTVVREHVLGDSIVRVKIWEPDGRIIYSDEPALIGLTFPLGEDERDVLNNPQIRADVSDLDEPENVYEREAGKLLEAYRPVWTPSGRPLLFESYFRYDEVTARSGQLWRGFAGVTLSSLLLLVVLLSPVLWRLLDRLRRAQTQREALLQHAVEASADERKRIAGALHDGAVQDLAATSFAVAGAAERAEALGQPELAAELRVAARTVRTSIGGLRSLLVEIYPPSLATAGLPTALEDLAAALRSRNIVVSLDFDEEVTMSAEHQQLMFRVAQECLNNAARHSTATRVDLRLHRSKDLLTLEISDNGRGFDPNSKLADPEEGHFGLRVLGDVAARAGAELDLATAPGAGTRWRLRVATR